MLNGLMRDIKHSTWSLSRAKVFSGAAILSLSIAIAANLTAFSLMRAIEFPALPYPGAERLYQIDASSVTRGVSGFPLSLPDYFDLQARAHSFRTIGVSFDTSMVLTIPGHRASVAVKAVSSSFFRTLGVNAASGRTFTDIEVRTGASNVVVLGHRLWLEAFSGNARTVGSVVRLDDESFTVLGVMPPRFDENAEAWIPLIASSVAEARDNRLYTVVARLPDDGAPARASTELRMIGEQLAVEYSRTNLGWGLSMVSFGALRSQESGGGYFQLQTAVLILLLIACANVGNLMLARSVTRRRETAVRVALGASPVEVARLPVIEAIILAGTAAIVGFLMSIWSTAAATRVGGFPDSVHVPIGDLISLVVALGLAVLCGIVVGWLPALDAGRVRSAGSMRDGGARGATSSALHKRFRSTLVASEIACALILVVGATLMARSLWEREHRALGFDPQHAFRGDVSFEGDRYSDIGRARAAVLETVRRLQGLRGVRAAGALSYPLPAAFGTQTPVLRGGTADDVLGPEVRRVVQSVTPGYFSAMGVSTISGSVFSDATSDPFSAVVNEEFARLAWPKGNAVGQRLTVSTAGSRALPAATGSQVTVTIIGVVASIRRSAMHDRLNAVLYLPFASFPSASITLFVRTEGDPASTVPAVRAVLGDLDNRLMLEGLSTLEDDIAAFLRPTRLYATLLTTFALLALLLAVTGVYASMAYSVEQQTRDIGIRLALGANRPRLVRLVVWQGLRLGLAGIAIGFVLSIGATRLLRSLLFGVGATDIGTLFGAAAVLGVVVLTASYIPARRASGVDPALTLRSE